MAATYLRHMAVLKKLWLQVMLLLFSAAAIGQQLMEIKGTVYDISRRNPMESVTVMATNGQATMTDTLGHYKILVRITDSVFFSYQNKVTGKYPVASMQDPNQFNMALHVQTNNLPPVTVYDQKLTKWIPWPTAVITPNISITKSPTRCATSMWPMAV
jgi:hypothetical protein